MRAAENTDRQDRPSVSCCWGLSSLGTIHLAYSSRQPPWWGNKKPVGCCCCCCCSAGRSIAELVGYSFYLFLWNVCVCLFLPMSLMIKSRDRKVIRSNEYTHTHTGQGFSKYYVCGIFSVFRVFDQPELLAHKWRTDMMFAVSYVEVATNNFRWLIGVFQISKRRRKRRRSSSKYYCSHIYTASFSSYG